MGRFNGEKGKPFKTHQSNFKSRSGDKWALLFKRPFKSKLVAINNRKWVERSDPGGETSKRQEVSSGQDVAGSLDVGCVLSLPIANFRIVDGGKRSQTIPYSSEVCMIPVRSSPSLSSSFSFAEERFSGVLKKGCSELVSVVPEGESEMGRKGETVEVVRESVLRRERIFDRR